MSGSKQYITWQQIDQAVINLTKDIEQSNWMPDLIVGLSRGGLPLAVSLSHSLDLPMVPVTVNLRDHLSLDAPTNLEFLVHMLNDEELNVLIVDDINDSGATINYISDYLINRVTEPAWISVGGKCRFATMLSKSTSDAKVDYYDLEIDPVMSHVWWVFPWEKVNQGE